MVFGEEDNNMKNNKSKEKKKNRILALLIAIFFSLFVWLYLKKYKKFFTWLGVLVILIILEIIIFNLENPLLLVISQIIGFVVPFYVWVSAISDAWRLKENKEKIKNG